MNVERLKEEVLRIFPDATPEQVEELIVSISGGLNVSVTAQTFHFKTGNLSISAESQGGNLPRICDADIKMEGLDSSIIMSVTLPEFDTSPKPLQVQMLVYPFELPEINLNIGEPTVLPNKQ